MSQPTARSGSPAETFLRLCLVGRSDPSRLEAARELALRQGFDWEAFLALAEQQNLSPLLYHALRDQHFAPESALSALKEAYDYTARRNLLLQHELRSALRSLAAASLDAIVLKGAVLAEIIYGNIALRPMIDLDLLVDRAQMPAAIELLLAAGYTQDIEPRVGATLEYENELLLLKPGIEETQLELHWTLFDSPFYQQELALDWFWSTAQEINIEGTTYLILSPEALLLHLCGHLPLHHAQEAGMLWLNDTAEVIRFHQNDIDWDLFLAKTGQYQLVLSVRQVLPLVAGQWAAPVPGDVLAALEALEPTAEERRVFAWHTAAERSVAQRIWSDLANMPGARQRLRYAIAKLFPSPSYMLPRYQIPHRALLPAYYLFHFATGIASGIRYLATGVGRQTN